MTDTFWLDRYTAQEIHWHDRYLLIETDTQHKRFTGMTDTFWLRQIHSTRDSLAWQILSDWDRYTAQEIHWHGKYFLIETDTQHKRFTGMTDTFYRYFLIETDIQRKRFTGMTDTFWLRQIHSTRDSLAWQIPSTDTFWLRQIHSTRDSLAWQIPSTNTFWLRQIHSTRDSLAWQILSDWDRYTAQEIHWHDKYFLIETDSLAWQILSDWDRYTAQEIGWHDKYFLIETDIQHKRFTGMTNTFWLRQIYSTRDSLAWQILSDWDRYTAQEIWWHDKYFLIHTTYKWIKKEINFKFMKKHNRNQSMALKTIDWFNIKGEMLGILI